MGLTIKEKMKNNTTSEKLELATRQVFSDTMDMRHDKKATLVGIRFVDDQIVSEKISDHGDVYNLISEIPMFAQSVSNYDMLSILTAGWAAPVNNDEDDNIPPSVHKDRRRVMIAMVGNTSTQYSAIMAFDDEKDEPIYLENEGAGALKDEFVNALELIGW